MTVFLSWPKSLNLEPGALEGFFVITVSCWIGPSVEYVPFPVKLSLVMCTFS